MMRVGMRIDGEVILESVTHVLLKRGDLWYAQILLAYE